MFDLLAQNITAIIGTLGALAFLVVVIVEITKELPGINGWPTKAWTIVVSMVVCMAVVAIYFAMAGLAIEWYYFALAFFGAFIVAYVAMYGWDNTKELWERFKERKDK